MRCVLVAWVMRCIWCLSVRPCRICALSSRGSSKASASFFSSCGRSPWGRWPYLWTSARAVPCSLHLFSSSCLHVASLVSGFGGVRWITISRLAGRCPLSLLPSSGRTPAFHGSAVVDTARWLAPLYEAWQPSSSRSTAVLAGPRRCRQLCRRRGPTFCQARLYSVSHQVSLLSSVSSALTVSGLTEHSHHRQQVFEEIERLAARHQDSMEVCVAIKLQPSLLLPCADTPTRCTSWRPSRARRATTRHRCASSRWSRAGPPARRCAARSCDCCWCVLASQGAGWLQTSTRSCLCCPRVDQLAHSGLYAELWGARAGAGDCGGRAAPAGGPGSTACSPGALCCSRPAGTAPWPPAAAVRLQGAALLSGSRPGAVWPAVRDL